MMNAELLKEVKAYLRPARKCLVCSRKSKDDFYRDILASAEEYLQLHPNASKRELCEYLGDCESLASCFLADGEFFLWIVYPNVKLFGRGENPNYCWQAVLF